MASLVTIAMTVVAFVFHRQILTLLIQPAESLQGDNIQLIYTRATEMLGISMKISLLGGLMLAFPLLVYQLVMFVSPGLTPKEKRYLYVSMPGIFLAFVAGVAFGYLILLPPAMRFLLTFNTDIASPFISIGDYINLMVNLLFWLGIVFETPVVMFMLAKLRVVTYKTFTRGRKLAVILAFILGAMITPTFDPINQSLVAIPIVMLYEIGILLARFARRREESLPVRVG